MVGMGTKYFIPCHPLGLLVIQRDYTMYSTAAAKG